MPGVSRRRFLALAIIFAIIVSVLVGVGVAVSQKKDSTRHTEPLPLPFKNGILDDSSFASVTTIGGVRLLMFQDSSGYIRQTIRSPLLSDSWASPFDSIVTKDAKNYTPLVAFLENTMNVVSTAITKVCSKESSNN